MLEFQEICKSFGSARALDKVSFSLRRGEIHALVGENGAGKSTLIRTLAGDYVADSGKLLLDNEELRFSQPRDALKCGIGCVHQIPMFVPNLSVTENLLLGTSYTHRRAGLVDWRAEHRAARSDLAGVGLNLDPRTPLELLRPHERQLVAVARAMRRGLRVLVLDEVTASLSQPEVEIVHSVVRSLAARGVTILYVSHRLDEIFSLAETITVLRDGKWIATVPTKGLSQNDVASLIVGQDMSDLFERRDSLMQSSQTNSRMSVRGVADSRLKPISFEVASGEVLGLAGLGGAGRTRLLRMLFGVSAADTGSMSIAGEPYSPRNPREAIARGVALVTEDRQHDGYVPMLPIWQNMTLPHVSRYRRKGMLNLRHERAKALGDARRLAVRMPSIDANMTQLSGGNQQKAIFGRWVSEPLNVLLLDEPTHGVDLKSKGEIYDIVRDLAATGTSIIIASSEFEELESLCDRVLLMHNAELIGSLSGTAISKEAILHALLQQHRN